MKRNPQTLDPHEANIVEVSKRTDFFEYDDKRLARFRLDLLRQSVGFFLRKHPKFYPEHFAKFNVTAENVSLRDLTRLAVPAEYLRYQGQRRFLVPNSPRGGARFQSSGTAGLSPVTIYRSPLDLFVQRIANMLFFDYLTGTSIGNGTALLMASPELRRTLAFVGLVYDAFKHRGSRIIFGLKLKGLSGGRTIWELLTPNKIAITRFCLSARFPKYVISAPDGIYGLIRSMQKSGSHFSPIRLGVGGAIVTGGGSKKGEVPPLPDLIEQSALHFRTTNAAGADVPAPFIDVLGFTESLMIFPSAPFSLIKHPHPLTEIFIVNPDSLRPIEGTGQEGLLGLWNPQCTSYFEAVYPGLVVKRVDAGNSHGRGFEIVRRMKPEEGWYLQRSCGEVLGQAFKGS